MSDLNNFCLTKGRLRKASHFIDKVTNTSITFAVIMKMNYMEHSSIRCMINNEFLVIDLSAFCSQYKRFNLKSIVESQKISIPSTTEIELGDFDLRGKMNYQNVDLLNLKLTFLDEKSIQISNQDTYASIRSLFENVIIHKEVKPDQEDDDWFGEKLCDGKYPKTTFHLSTEKNEWNSPSSLKEFLTKVPKLNNVMVSTGGYLFEGCQNPIILDLCRTHENHLFVEDEEHLLLGTGLSPATSIHFLRNQYPSIDVILEDLPPYLKQFSSLWDICCFHPHGKKLLEEFERLYTTASIHNGKRAININPSLINKFTPGIPLYFLIPKSEKNKSKEPIKQVLND